MVLNDGRALAIGSGGGSSGGEALSYSTEIYDRAADTWVVSDDALTAVSTRAVTLADGRVLIAGGGATAPSFASTSLIAEIYDPSRDLWERQPNMAARRAAHSLTLLGDGTVLVAGGVGAMCTCGPWTSIASAEVFSPGAPDAHYPAARDDRLTTPQDQTLTVTAPGLLANDSDTDGDVLTVSVQTPPVHGVVTISQDGSLEYVPETGVVYAETFAYRACDPSGRCDQARVKVTVTAPGNRPPIGRPEEGGINEEHTLTVPAPGVLGNDSDPDGDAMTARRLSGPAHGSLALHTDGSFTYTPDPDYFGPDSFVYEACDHVDLCSPPVIVSLTVAPVNDTPRPVGDTYETNESTLTVPAMQLVANDAPGPDNEAGQTLSVSRVLASEGTRGTVSLFAGFVVYTPEPGFTGRAVFAYETCDDGESAGVSDPRCATGQVTIDVTAAAAPPIADDLEVTADEDVPGAITLSASDPNGDPLTFEIVDPPGEGSLDPSGSGGAQRIYTPNADFNGNDRFTYRANDGSANSNTAEVKITVRAVNDSPVAVADDKTTERDTPLKFPAADLAVNDSKGPDNEAAQTLGVASVTAGADTHGAVVLDGNEVTFTPASQFIGDATFGYRVCDDGETRGDPDPRCADGTVTIEVSRPEGVQLAAVEIVPKTGDELDPGQTRRYQAIGVYADGSRAALDEGVTWASVNEGVATVTSAGLATALAAGTTSIKATFDDVSAETALTVGSPRVTSIELEPARGLIVVGNDQRFTAVGVHADGTSETLPASAVSWMTSAPTVAVVGGDGVATGQSPGETTITAHYEDASGSAALTVRPAIANGSLPTVDITNPTDGQTVTEPIEIRGTATDDEFLKYVLELAPAGEDAFTTIGESDEPVTDDVLGTLDPTMLLNDLYTLRLTAYDRGNNSTIAEVTVQVDRELKIGLFSLSFDDLTIPVSGLDITVTRTYDNRDKTVGDFGVGWHLGIRSARVRANRVQGNGWRVDRFGFLGYRLVAQGEHKVSVTLPDGEVEEFDLTPQPSSRNGPFDELRAVYTPRAGTLGTLDPVGSDQIFIFDAQPGQVTLYDDEFAGQPYDPERFEYRSPDGTRILVSKRNAVEQITDRNDNSVTIGPDGLTHSSGVRIDIGRDAQGRITRIVDPRGNDIRYAYDANGDLETHTDAEGNTTRFLYDVRHNLIEIRDPLGRRPARNEYDDDGRLVAIIDALGKRVEVTYDLAADRQTIRDRRGNQTVLTYDNDGNVVSERTAAGTTTHTFDGRGNELTVTDPLGRATTRTYDDHDNVLSVTTPAGRTTSFTYGPLNQLLTLTDPGGQVTTHAYDADGNLLSSEACGATTRFAYDARNNPRTVTDARGGITTYVYDASGRLMSSSDPGGTTITYTNDLDGNRVSSRVVRSTRDGPRIAVTSYVYDAANRRVRTTTPDGFSRRTVYDSFGRATASIDELGRVTRFDRNGRGEVARTTYPGASTTSTEYDANGNPTVDRDQLGRATVTEYDAIDRPVRTIGPDGTSTHTVFDAAGQVVVQTDARGVSTGYRYDADGQPIAVDRPLGQTVSFVYDAEGRKRQTIDPAGRVTEFGYDCGDRHTTTTYPDDTTVSTEYDDLGRVTSETGESGDRTEFGYDSVGRLTTVTDAMGAVTTYGYDEVGNRIAETNAEGQVTSLAYDDRGRQTSRTLPLGQSDSVTYDAVGNVVTRTDFNGRTTRYAYDLLNRLASKEPDAAFGAPTVRFSYTPTGKRASMVDATGTTTYSYDDGDRLTGKVTPQGAIAYTRDPAGNLLSMRSSDPRGVSIAYAWDALGRLTTVTDERLEDGTSRYTYDAAGNLASQAYPNGVASVRTYDLRNRPTRIAITNPDSTLATYNYELGPAGARRAVDEAHGRRVEYGYDDLGRLKKESVTGDPDGRNGDIDYAYDRIGNRVSRASTLDGVQSRSHSYDENGRVLDDAYDNNGNTLRTGQHVYGYDFEDRVVQANDLTGRSVIVYNGDGQRVAERSHGDEVEFLIDDQNPTGIAQAVEERTDAGTRVNDFGYALISQRGSSSTPSFALHDAIGSVTAITDPGGDVNRRFAYDAFGLPLASIENDSTRHLFAGESFSERMDAYYLRARWYAPDPGRFLTADKHPHELRDPRSLNRYAYAWNDPQNRTDPSGNFPTLADVGVALSVVQQLYKTYLDRSEYLRTAIKRTLAKGTLFASRGNTNFYEATAVGDDDRAIEIAEGRVDDRTLYNACGGQSDSLVNKYVVNTTISLLPFANAFETACDYHDQCYGTLGAPRSLCDSQFRLRTQRACERVAAQAGLTQPDPDCEYWAALFETAVVVFGRGFYEQGQDEARARVPFFGPLPFSIDGPAP